MTTGWRRLIGCLKLQVIFRKRATSYRALLLKMTCKDKASYGSSPPCTYLTKDVHERIFWIFFRGGRNSNLVHTCAYLTWRLVDVCQQHIVHDYVCIRIWLYMYMNECLDLFSPFHVGKPWQWFLAAETRIWVYVLDLELISWILLFYVLLANHDQGPRR